MTPLDPQKIVMAGLDPAIHGSTANNHADARVEPGHDGGGRMVVL
jgi:hypothetical protein